MSVNRGECAGAVYIMLPSYIWCTSVTAVHLFSSLPQHPSFGKRKNGKIRQNRLVQNMSWNRAKREANFPISDLDIVPFFHRNFAKEDEIRKKSCCFSDYNLVAVALSLGVFALPL